jgi:hypothetical protein
VGLCVAHSRFVFTFFSVVGYNLINAPSGPPLSLSICDCICPVSDVNCSCAFSLLDDLFVADENWLCFTVKDCFKDSKNTLVVVRCVKRPSAIALFGICRQIDSSWVR